MTFIPFFLEKKVYLVYAKNSTVQEEMRMLRMDLQGTWNLFLDEKKEYKKYI